jgi:hypothetical protein
MIQLPLPPVGRLVGFVMKSIEPGHAIFEMEADERHTRLRSLHRGPSPASTNRTRTPAGCRTGDSRAAAPGLW